MKTTYAVMTLICAMGMGLMGCVADAANESADELAQDSDPNLDEAAQSLAAQPPPISESICGSTNDLVSVNDFTGKHGITSRFVQREKIPVGRYFNGENGLCSGTLIAHDLFLTNSHCIPGNASLITSGRVTFGDELDGWESERLPARTVTVAAVVENGTNGLDYAILRLNGLPGLTYGHNQIANYDPASGSVITIIGHPGGDPKQVDVGHASYSILTDDIYYDDLDTLGGSSGSGILDTNGEMVGLHFSSGCGSLFTANHGEKMTDLIAASSTLANAPRHIIVSEQGDPSIYIIAGGARLGIGSMEEYDALGLRHEDHRVLPVGSLSGIPTAPRDGTVLRTTDGGIYLVFGGAKFHIPSMEEFNALGLSGPDVNPAPYWATYALPLIPQHDTLLKERSSDGIYVVRWGYLYWIPSWDVFDAYGYTTRRVRIVPNGSLAQIPYGGTLN